MPKISVLHEKARTIAGKFNSADVLSQQELTADIVLKEGWSPSLFKGFKRSATEFVGSSVIGLDIDGGWSLEEALKAFSGYWHIIGTTRSHGQVKNPGTPSAQAAADRFRVVLQLTEIIPSAEKYKLVIRNIVKQFNIPADESAIDAARWFIPCKSLFSTNTSGVFLNVEDFSESPKQEPIKESKPGAKGSLSTATMNFLTKQESKDSWHKRFFKASMDFKEQGYTEAEAAQMLRVASPLGELDSTDLEQLGDVYDNREGKLNLRIEWPEYNEKGEVDKNSYLNQRYALLEILKYDIHTIVRRDLTIINHVTFSKPEYLSDGLAAKIATDVRQLRLATGESLRETIATIARENKKDPLLDIFTSLKWDKKPNIENLFNTIVLPPDTTEFAKSIYQLYLKRWLIGVVAKIVHPGSENNVLVFQGQQAAGKSRWFQRFAELWPDGYGEGNINPEDKDHELRHLDNFIWHVAEFDSTTSRREVGALKDFFTKHTVSVRRPYSRYPVVGRSSCSFCATVNNLDFLHDLTGNRRYLSIPVISTNPDHIISMRQVFAEAKALYDAGERQWFTREEIVQTNEMNSQFMSKDDYIEAVDAGVSPGENAMTTSDILINLGFTDLKVTKAVMGSIRSALSKKGIEQRSHSGMKYYRVNISKVGDILKLIRNSDSAKAL